MLFPFFFFSYPTFLAPSSYNQPEPHFANEESVTLWDYITLPGHTDLSIGTLIPEWLQSIYPLSLHL